MISDTIEHPHPLLSPSQEAQFHRDGYCVVDDVFSATELDEIEEYFDRYKTEGHKSFHGHQYDEVDFKKEQLRAMQPHQHSEKALAWLTHPNVGAVLERLLGVPALGVQTMYYYKPPGAKGQGMHQDNFYLLSKPATCAAAWTPIDSADLDNGCLWVLPGSNEMPIQCPESVKGDSWMDYGDTHINPFPRGKKPIAVPVQRGQTMFFGGQLIHGSGPNRTKDRYRRTFIGHYIDQQTDSVAKYYHPIFNMQRQVVSGIEVASGGGPCGDGWQGAVH